VSRFYFLVEAERVTRLCGAGAPFRPLFSSRSVVLCSGARRLSLSLQGKTIPDEAVSIGKREAYVKCKSRSAVENLFGGLVFNVILFGIEDMALSSNLRWKTN
jgi:hypothetical protein